MNPDTYRITFVVNHPRHQAESASRLCAAMRADGFKNVSITNQFNPDENADLVIMWAHKRLDVIQHQKSCGKRYLVMERAYVGDRHYWVSLGYDGLNGRADFCNKTITDSHRWDTYFKSHIKPWRVKDDGPVVVVGQVPGDAAHSHIDIRKWYEQTISELNQRNLPVIFRQHPLDKKKGCWKPTGLKFEYDKNASIEKTFQTARACVTFSSNSGVLSVLQGVPTVAMDMGSMAYDVASQDLNCLDYTPDRTLWCSQIAYCQWTPDELLSGVAWKHIKQGLH